MLVLDESVTISVVLAEMSAELLDRRDVDDGVDCGSCSRSGCRKKSMSVLADDSRAVVEFKD